ncbi:transcription elongation factor NusA [Sulfodiicoccus acidiphilus]|nr:transcription elongation factor NusA [Sulfodiicoccus acidiphilus]
MKIPLDSVCVRSGLLCDRCQGLVDSGDVDSGEVEIMRVLLELEESQFRELKDSVYHRAIRIGHLLVLVVTSGPNMTQSRWVKVSKALQEKLKVKTVRIVEKVNDLKASASQLLSPARVLGVNTLWLPDGTVQYVVRVSKNERRYLPSGTLELERALSKLYSTTVKIRVE